LKIDSVLILAAGFGTRLKPYTDNLPKSLLPLNDTNPLRNLIEQSLKYISGAKIYINASYKAEKIIQEVTKFPVAKRPYIIWERKPLGPAFTTTEFCNQSEGNVLVLHGDVFFSDTTFAELAASIDKVTHDSSILLCHKKVKYSARSIITEQAGFVKSILEVSLHDSDQNSNIIDRTKKVWSSSGALVIKRNSLLNFTAEIGSSLSPSLINYIANNENLYLEKCKGPRVSIDDENSYLNAIKLDQKDSKLFDRTI